MCHTMKVTFQSADKADSPCSVIGLTCWVRLPVVRRYSIIGILLHGMQLFSVMPTHDKKTHLVALWLRVPFITRG